MARTCNKDKEAVWQNEHDFTYRAYITKRIRRFQLESTDMRDFITSALHCHGITRTKEQ